MLELARDADGGAQARRRIVHRETHEHDGQCALAERHDHRRETLALDALLEEARGVEQRGHRGLAEREQHLVRLEIRRLEPAQRALDHVLEARALDERAQEALGEVARALGLLLVHVCGESHEDPEGVVAAALVEGALGEQRRAPRQVEVGARVAALVELAQQDVEVVAGRHLAQVVERRVLDRGRRADGLRRRFGRGRHHRRLGHGRRLGRHLGGGEAVHEDPGGRVRVQRCRESAPRRGAARVGGEHLGERREPLAVEARLEAQARDAALRKILLQLGQAGMRQHAASAQLAEALGEQLEIERPAPRDVAVPCAEAAFEHGRELGVSRPIEAAGADQPSELEQQRRELGRGPQAHHGRRGHRSPQRHPLRYIEKSPAPVKRPLTGNDPRRH